MLKRDDFLILSAHIILLIHNPGYQGPKEVKANKLALFVMFILGRKAI